MHAGILVSPYDWYCACDVSNEDTSAMLGCDKDKQQQQQISKILPLFRAGPELIARHNLTHWSTGANTYCNP